VTLARLLRVELLFRISNNVYYSKIKNDEDHKAFVDSIFKDVQAINSLITNPQTKN